MGVVVPDKPQKIKILNHGWYDRVHVAGRGYVNGLWVLISRFMKL